MADPVNIYGPPPDPGVDLSYDPAILADIEASFGLSPLAPPPADLAGAPPVPAPVTGMEAEFAPQPEPEPFSMPALGVEPLAAPAVPEPAPLTPMPEPTNAEQVGQEIDRQLAVATADPEAYARENAMRDVDAAESVTAQRDANNAKHDRLLLEQEQIRSANDKKAAATMAAIALDAEELANREIDPTLDAKDVVAGLLAALFSPDKAMQMMRERISLNVETQKANIANGRAALDLRQGAVAELHARNADVYASGRAAVIAEWKKFENQLTAIQGQFDQRGTLVAQTIVPSILKARQEQAKAAMATETELRKRSIEDAELKIKRSAEARGWAGEKRAGVGQKAELAAMGLDEKGNPIPGWAPPVDDKSRKLTAEAEKAELDAEELRRAIRVGAPGEIVNSDGTEFRAPTKEEGAKARDMKSKVATLTQALDDMILLRRQDGWSSDTARSPSWQKARQALQRARLAVKDTKELGVLAGPDMQIIDEFLGGDPTQIRDPLPAMRKARAATDDDFNNVLQSQGYTGARIEAPRRKELEDYERPKSDDLAIAKKPIAGFTTDPRKVAALVEERKLAIHNLRDKEVTLPEVKEIQGAITEQLAAGIITEEQAAKLMQETMFLTRGDEAPKGPRIRDGYRK